MPATVSRDRRCKQEDAPLAVTGRIFATLRVAVELEPIGGVGLRIDCAADRNRRPRRHRGIQHREVLQLVGSGIGIVCIVCGDAAGPQIDAQAVTAVDRVAQQGVARAGAADDGNAGGPDPAVSAEGDDICRGHRCPAHYRIAGTVLQQHTVLLMPPVGGACEIGADAVALDHRACAGAIDLDADNGVAGDPVAVVRAGTAHRRVVRTAGDMDSVAAIRDRCASRGIHTDPVAADHVVVGTLTVDLDAVLAISGDDVALGDERTTHRVGIGAALDAYAVDRIAAAQCARNIRANVVASDDVATDLGILEHDPVGVAGNDIAFACIVASVGVGTDQVAGDGSRGAAIEEQDALDRIADQCAAISAEADDISLHLVASSPVGDLHAQGIAGDHVAGIRDSGTDTVRARAVPERHPALSIAERDQAGLVDTDIVPLHEVVGGTTVDDINAEPVIAGNDIAFGDVIVAVCIGADAIAARARHHADPAVAARGRTAIEIQRTARIGPDIVADDNVAGGARAHQPDAVRAVTRHDIARRRSNTSDGVVRGRDVYTSSNVAQRGASSRIGPHVVAGDQGSRGRRLQLDADPAGRSADHVALAGRRATDDIVGGVEPDALREVAHRRGAGRVGADVVATDLVAGAGAVVGGDADPDIAAGKDIAVCGGAAADDVVVTVVDADAGIVPSRRGAGGVQAEPVAGDGVTVAA